MKQNKQPRLPLLVRFLILHAAWGIVFGAAFVLLLIHLDFLGVGTMLERDQTGIATFLLFFQTGLTFGGVSMGVAVMNLREDDEPPAPPGKLQEIWRMLLWFLLPSLSRWPRSKG